MDDSAKAILTFLATGTVTHVANVSTMEPPETRRRGVMHMVWRGQGLCMPTFVTHHPCIRNSYPASRGARSSGAAILLRGQAQSAGGEADCCIVGIGISC